MGKGVVKISFYDMIVTTFFENYMIYETQIFKPLEATRHHNSTKILILLPFRGDLLCIVHYDYETLCNVIVIYVAPNFFVYKLIY